MSQRKEYRVSTDESLPFRNNVALCVGTGRMGLALHKEYLDQLAVVQRDIGFHHIRGHGLFCDDMAIYREYKDEDGAVHSEYNFTYLDRVMDAYLSLGLRPFLELGFMPGAMASGEQTCFYWKGNVTPPKDYTLWNDLLRATLGHLISRYGADEATSWPIEVWNEPNLEYFWKDKDMDEYFRLFRESFYAVKSVDSRFRVGGPAICGIDDERWLRLFLEYCSAEKIPLDFVTRHHYCIEVPVVTGRYGYPALTPPAECLRPLRISREMIDSFPEFKGLEMHCTEFNTSYSPRTPLHDTNLNAAYVAWLLSELGDTCESYSYWTFGDVFEESDVPFTTFHGGFGLLANGCIPKPTFWVFRFYKQLQGVCLHRSPEALITRDDDGVIRGLGWNIAMTRGTGELSLDFTLPAAEEEYCLVTQTVDEAHGNPLKLWHDMGEPANPSAAQTGLLRDCARPWISSERLAAQEGTVSLSFILEENAVLFFTLTPSKIESDRGFDYVRTMENR